MTCTTLLLDIGGVFLTNGWDRHSREKAAKKFNLDLEEINSRHALTFDTYEIGKITLEVYIERVVFNKPRQFTLEDFRKFMLEQSQPHWDMIRMVRDKKNAYELTSVAVTNEGRELMEHRIKEFRLNEFIDFFVCSSFVGLRKPDEDIFRLALDLAQVKPQEVIYIDDRPMLVEIATQIGMNAIHHRSVEETERLMQGFLNSNDLTKG